MAGKTLHANKNARNEVLKGHGFIRAVQCLLNWRPLGPEGCIFCPKPQGLKPGIFLSFAARINPCPFKTSHDAYALPEMVSFAFRLQFVQAM
jgi:hypothetical protein